jgi:hypothetical protein
MEKTEKSKLHTISSYDWHDGLYEDVTLRGTLIFERWIGPRSHFAVYLGDDGLVYLLTPRRGHATLEKVGYDPADKGLRNRLLYYMNWYAAGVDSVLVKVGGITGPVKADLGEKHDLDAELRQMNEER